MIHEAVVVPLGLFNSFICPILHEDLVFFWAKVRLLIQLFCGPLLLAALSTPLALLIDVVLVSASVVRILLLGGLSLLASQLDVAKEGLLFILTLLFKF